MKGSWHCIFSILFIQFNSTRILVYVSTFSFRIKFILPMSRFWWILAFSLSLWLCGSSIHSIWMKWSLNPVKMSLTEREMPISEIPFPAVTICPETKTYYDKLDVSAAYKSLIEQKNNFSDIE